jgi:glycosyltransferase involved in cell wall biosynthesis
MVKERSSTSEDLEDAKRTMLVLVSHYLPGFKAGGPIRSIAALVEKLDDEFECKIICGDRDLGDKQPFAGEPVGRWYRYGSASVLRIPPGLAGAWMVVRSLRQESYDVLYVNGFFERAYAMLPLMCRKARLLPQKPTVLAPRGQLSPGALSLKRKEKSLYIKMSTWLDFYRKIIWHASTSLEEADIRRVMGNLPAIDGAGIQSTNSGEYERGNSGAIAIAKDMHLTLQRAAERKQRKRAGQLRAVFVSRISPKKNLLGALRMLEGLAGDVLFDIYGPAEDLEYWGKCKKAIGKLPPNVRVNYMGMIEHERVGEVFGGHDLFLFPTLSENYGHVICEALSAGCPVLISDQTPWRSLESQGAGWDVPLEDTERFRAILQQCIDAEEEWYDALVARAAAYGNMAASDPVIIEENRNLFRYAACQASLVPPPTI